MLTALTACLALAACGGDGGSTGNATAGQGSGLGPERYEALDAVYVAAAAFDVFAEDEDADPRDFAEAAQPTIEACDALDGEDELLAELKRSCPLVTELTEQLLKFSDCAEGDPDACVTAVSDGRAIMRQIISLGRRSDGVVNRSELSSACKQGLVSPPAGYDVIAQYGRGFAYLQRALRTGSEADNATAQSILTAAGADAKRVPSGKQLLAAFRRGCA